MNGGDLLATIEVGGCSATRRSDLPEENRNAAPIEIAARGRFPPRALLNGGSRRSGGGVHLWDSRLGGRRRRACWEKPKQRPQVSYKLSGRVEPTGGGSSS